MLEGSKRDHNTTLESASIVSSGSGNVYVGGSFVPTPTLPINGSNLPNRHTNFVGRRDEIGKVMEALASRAWIVTIDGMGGIGKTTLALEVSHLCRDRTSEYAHIPNFKGYIWASARDKADFCLADVLYEILSVLTPFEARARQLDQSEQLNLANRVLSSDPYLLIIDNFESVHDDSLYRFLRDLPNPSKVLITSRHHVLQPGEIVVNLDGLQEDDAVRLLRLEAERLHIPIHDQDIGRLRIIARKSYGVPFVLRWIMESVFNGKSLEWVLASLEKGTSEGIFNYIFEPSLSLVDAEARHIFCSMALLPTWSRIETIAAMNTAVSALQDRLGHLVSLSLIEDNRSLKQSDRHYQLPAFARYLATKEFANSGDERVRAVAGALTYYLNNLHMVERGDAVAKKILETEFANIDSIVQSALHLGHTSLLDPCMRTAEIMNRVDYSKGRMLFSHMMDVIDSVSNKDAALKLLNLVGNRYLVHPPLFFGREEVLRYVRETFENDKPDTSIIALTGAKRIGKTALLYRLCHQESSKCVYVSIPLSEISGNEPAQLLYFITQRIGDELVNKNMRVADSKFEDFVEQPYQAFFSYLDSVLKRLRTKRLVLMLDEFDWLLEHIQRGRIDIEETLFYFRSMVLMRTFGVITASVTRVHDFPSSPFVSPFFNLAVPHHISFLKTEEALDLVQQPTHGLLKYEAQAIMRILNLSGSHPDLLLGLCSLIMELCRQKGRLVVDIDMVETAVLHLYKQNHLMQYLLDHLDKVEQSIIITAASIAEADTGLFMTSRLRESLGKDKMKISQIRKALENLIKSEIITLDDQGNHRFTMGIFQRWLTDRITSSET